MVKRRFSTVEMASLTNDPWTLGIPAYGGKLKLSSRDRLLIDKGGMGPSATDIYLDTLTDSQAFACFDRQVSEICSRDWFMEPGGPSELDAMASKFIEESMRNLSTTSDDEHDGLSLVSNSQGVDGLYRGLALCLITGISVAEVIWYRDINGRPLPREIKIRDSRRFRLESSQDGKIWLKLLTKQFLSDGIYVPAKKFIVCRYWAIPNDDPYGQGAGRYIYYPVQWKREALTLWLSIIDKHTDPTSIGTYPETADPEQIEEFTSLVSNIARDMSATMPEGFKIDFQTANLSNSELLTTLEKSCDMAISKVIMGESVTGEQMTSGSYGRESISNSIRIMKAKALSDSISEVLNNTLLKWICKLNFPGAKPPRIWRQFDDKTEVISLLKDLKALGYEASEEYIESVFGIPLNAKVKKKEFV